MGEAFVPTGELAVGVWFLLSPLPLGLVGEYMRVPLSISLALRVAEGFFGRREEGGW